MLETLKISTNDLRVGMFVSALDRSWLETPFIIQGFRIESRTQIDKLREYCNYVFVDTVQSRQPAESFKVNAGGKQKRMPLEHIFYDRNLEQYGDKSNFVDEKPRAEAALEALVGDVCDIFEQVGNGGKIDVIQLKKSVEPLIGSISRNPDACLWISRLKQHDEYSYQHALSSAIWAVSLGRELGFSRQDLRSLAMGGMLMDVGKLQIDSGLLKAERQLTNSESAQMQDHVNHGLTILQDSGIINHDVTSMVAYHHERYDGSGYPFGMKGDEIPPVARIAAIVDTYGAITSNRGYAAAISPSNAIRVLYEARNTDFQAELVEAFIRAIGVYPAGTLVELSSGEVAVVIAEYRTRRLRPKVLVLLDKNKQQLPKATLLDLQDVCLAGKQEAINIARSLEPGAYGIDLACLELENARISA
ncbi:diguanylate cyclase [Kineobactrum sediminis]|uniref:Diguanylate cyclase n=1 Tax=Kineobactrum sediminis TaxID=1905677 RepID=A0A2N5Y0W5_9GAMM|nr:HD-GYP domain-containing protein [Kineobactrum sediminis]PLW82045.1 diguanylate cyclase [Kineobactrum sediminis]